MRYCFHCQQYWEDDDYTDHILLVKQELIDLLETEEDDD